MAIGPWEVGGALTKVATLLVAEAIKRGSVSDDRMLFQFELNSEISSSSLLQISELSGGLHR